MKKNMLALVYVLDLYFILAIGAAIFYTLRSLIETLSMLMLIIQKELSGFQGPSTLVNAAASEPFFTQYQALLKTVFLFLFSVFALWAMFQGLNWLAVNMLINKKKNEFLTDTMYALAVAMPWLLIVQLSTRHISMAPYIGAFLYAVFLWYLFRDEKKNVAASVSQVVLYLWRFLAISAIWYFGGLILLYLAMLVAYTAPSMSAWVAILLAVALFLALYVLIIALLLVYKRPIGVALKVSVSASIKLFRHAFPVYTGLILIAASAYFTTHLFMVSFQSVFLLLPVLLVLAAAISAARFYLVTVMSKMK